MNQAEQDIQEIEISMEEAQKAVDMRNAIYRLQANKDYQKVFEQGYFIDEASRLVLLKASPAAEVDNIQGSIDKSIVGIGYCYRYMLAKIQMGNQKEKALFDAQESREDILAEAV